MQFRMLIVESSQEAEKTAFSGVVVVADAQGVKVGSLHSISYAPLSPEGRSHFLTHSTNSVFYLNGKFFDCKNLTASLSYPSP